MSEVYDTDSSFPFQNLTLTNPILMPGGTYFSKLHIDNKFPVYIQTPSCKTKNGIMKSGKKMYSELMFTAENSDFIQWIETLESKCQELIYNKRDKWFEIELNKEDIESYFSSPIRIFKSGKYYLVRCSIDSKIPDQPYLKIYDENENDIPADSIKENTQIISILEVQGIRCSAKSFQIEIEIKQIMVLTQRNLFEKCVIKTNKPLQTNLENINHAVTYNVAPQKNEIEEIEIEEIEIEYEKELKDDKIEKEEIKDEKEEIKYEKEDKIKEEENEEENINHESLGSNNDDIMTEFELTDIDNTSTIQLKDKKEMYYEMYQTAKRKAKLAKSLAISAFLEAKRIKNMYMLDDLEEDGENDDDENDDFDFENQELE